MKYRLIIFATIIFVIAIIFPNCTSGNKSIETDNSAKASKELQKNYELLNNQPTDSHETIVFSMRNQPFAEIMNQASSMNYYSQDIQLNSTNLNFQKIFKDIHNALPKSIREKLNNKMLLRVFPQLKEILKSTSNSNLNNIYNSVSAFLKKGKNWLSIKELSSQALPLSMGTTGILLYFFNEISNSIHSIQQSLQVLNRNIEIFDSSKLQTILYEIEEYFKIREANIKNNNPFIHFKKAIQLDAIRSKIMELFYRYKQRLEDSINLNLDDEFRVLNTRVTICEDYIKKININFKPILITIYSLKNIMLLKSDYDNPQELYVQIKLLDKFFKDITGIINNIKKIFGNNIIKVQGILSFSSTDTQVQKKLSDKFNSVINPINNTLNQIVSELNSFAGLLKNVYMNYIIEVTFDDNNNLIKIRRLIRKNR